MTTSELRESHARLLAALRWYVENDETNEGDGENSHFVAGKAEAIAAIAAAERVSEEEQAWSIVP